MHATHRRHRLLRASEAAAVRRLRRLRGQRLSVLKPQEPSRSISRRDLPVQRQPRKRRAGTGGCAAVRAHRFSFKLSVGVVVLQMCRENWGSAVLEGPRPAFVLAAPPWQNCGRWRSARVAAGAIDGPR